MIQLALNALYLCTYFDYTNPMLAGIEIIILWLMILKPIHSLLNKIAGYFFAYLAWVSFAAVLNGSIWWLNRNFSRKFKVTKVSLESVIQS
jgi:tryptophan-rich sensory protein